MTAAEIRNRIVQNCSHFTFVYKGKNCGIDPFSEDEFDIWCDNDTETVSSVKEVMNIPFFEGKSLSEIVGEIDIIDY